LLFSKRLIQCEMLDQAPEELAHANLADLRRINRHFGGHYVVRRTVERAVNGNRNFTLLDIGCASGDVARMLNAQYPHARITCFDYKTINMKAAPHPKVLADAFQLPFRPASFDFVLSSLFLHHFTDDQATELLRAFYLLARKALLICDLERQLIPYIFLPATRALFRWNRITVHDGIRSVRASFRHTELLQLARQAGIPNAEVRAHRPAFRLSMVARRY